MTDDRAELERQLALVKVGAWSAYCCHLDLCQIATEEEAESIRNSFLAYIEDGWGTSLRVWATERDALIDIRQHEDEAARFTIDARLALLA